MSAPSASRHGIGDPVPRVEDLRLLTGRGRYSDDRNLPGQAYAVVLRSPHAHARIRSIDAAAAKAQVQAMGQRLLGLSAAPKPADAADAAALALCHLAHAPVRARLAAATARATS